MLGHNPDRPAPVRIKRAELLLKLMRLDEAEAELAAVFPGALDRAARLLRSELLIFRADLDCAAQAAALLADLADETLDLQDRETLLVRQASALFAGGEHRRARDIAWRAATGLAPDVHAISLLLRLGLTGSEAQTLLAKTGLTPLPTRGLALRCALLARSGQVDLACQESGFERFFRRSTLFAPSLETEAFHASIATEVRAASDLFYSAGRQPGLHLWRVEGLPCRGMVTIPRLLAAIADAVKTYVSSWPVKDDHPFLQARPAQTKISARAAIAGQEGYEDWHTHDKAWLSGVYYVAVPPDAGDQSGAIIFGWPGGENENTASKGVDIASFYPAAGDIIMFPSSQHHRTLPLKRSGERLAIAFDVMPV